MNCYVLVGGRSRRMGQPKAGLAFAGTTFLGHIVEVASAAFERVIAVQRPDGEPLRGAETIFESPHDSEAPIFGVQRALQHAAGRCFVIAVDYPLLTAELLRFLASRFEHTSASILVPVWNGVPQILCAGYSSEALEAIDHHIASGRFDLRSLATGAEMIDEQVLRGRFAGEPLMNVNTPEDLQEAKRLYEQQGLLSSR